MMTISVQLAILGYALKRGPLKDSRVAFDVFEDRRLDDHESAVDPARVLAILLAEGFDEVVFPKIDDAKRPSDWMAVIVTIASDFLWNVKRALMSTLATPSP